MRTYESDFPRSANDHQISQSVGRASACGLRLQCQPATNSGQYHSDNTARIDTCHGVAGGIRLSLGIGPWLGIEAAPPLPAQTPFGHAAAIYCGSTLSNTVTAFVYKTTPGVLTFDFVRANPASSTSIPYAGLNPDAGSAESPLPVASQTQPAPVSTPQRVLPRLTLSAAPKGTNRQ